MAGRSVDSLRKAVIGLYGEIEVLDAEDLRRAIAMANDIKARCRYQLSLIGR